MAVGAVLRVLATDKLIGRVYTGAVLCLLRADPLGVAFLAVEVGVVPFGVLVCGTAGGAHFS